MGAAIALTAGAEHADRITGPWNITERLKLSGGLRGTSDHKSYDWAQFFGTQTTTFGGITPLPAPFATLPSALGLGAPGVLSGDRTDKALMPSAQLQYKILQQMVYRSYSRGFKAGGFNGTDASGIASRLPFKPEYVDAYEVGLKSEWFDHRVLVNVAIRGDLVLVLHKQPQDT